MSDESPEDWLQKTISLVHPKINRWRVLESDTGQRGSWSSCGNIMRAALETDPEGNARTPEEQLEVLTNTVSAQADALVSPFVRLQALYGARGIESTFDWRTGAPTTASVEMMAPAIVAQVLNHNSALHRTSLAHYEATINAQTRTIESQRQQIEKLYADQLKLIEITIAMKDQDVVRQAKTKAIEKGGELAGTLIDAIRLALAKKSGTPVDNLLATELRKFGNSLRPEQIEGLQKILDEKQLIPLLTVILEPEKAQDSLAEGKAPSPSQ